MQLVHLKNIDRNKQIPNLENKNDQSSSDTLIGKKIEDQPVNIPNQIKNQLKNINQLKTILLRFIRKTKNKN